MNGTRLPWRTMNPQGSGPDSVLFCYLQGVCVPKVIKTQRVWEECKTKIGVRLFSRKEKSWTICQSRAQYKNNLHRDFTVLRNKSRVTDRLMGLQWFCSSEHLSALEALGKTNVRDTLFAWSNRSFPILLYSMPFQEYQLCYTVSLWLNKSTGQFRE